MYSNKEFVHQVGKKKTIMTGSRFLHT